MSVYRAKYLVPVSSPPIEDGAVRICDGRIEQFGLWSDFQGGPATDLGEVVLMPGLVNAHCHLDYTSLRGAILPSHNFADWIARINDLKRTLTDEDYVDSINRGLKESLQTGTTTMINIESFPEIFLNLERPLLRVWWCLELLDIRSRIGTEAVFAGALALLDERTGWLGGAGLSPHAPYSTSLELYKLATECAVARGIPFTTHLAETAEEFEMFVRGSGKLYEFLARLGRDMSDVDGRTPFERMLVSGALPRRAILAHMNVLSSRDWHLLADRAPDFSVVHCPRCHSYFNRPTFPLEHFMALGLNLCLGTDSLASNHSLNMFSEMRHLLAKHAFVTPEEVLRMATLAGAKALGLPGELGEICVGASADLIAVPIDGNPPDVIESAIQNKCAPILVMVAGEVVYTK